MNIKINFDESEVYKNILQAFKPVQFKLDAQIMKDSNRYCPLDTSALQKSVITHSKLGSGLLVWSTPYAWRVYNDESFKISRQKNPNASRKWYEVAKSKNYNNWVKLANDEYHKNSK